MKYFLLYCITILFMAAWFLYHEVKIEQWELNNATSQNDSFIGGTRPGQK